MNSNWGVVLLEQNKVETPSAATGLSKTTSGANIVLNWSPVVADTAGGRELATSYEIYRDTSAGFTPSSGNRIATIGAPNFGGTSAGKIAYTDPGAAGKYSTTSGF